MENTAGIEQNLRYAGQYFDEESGLHFNLFRFYDPVCGRYTQGDPIGLAGGMNLYGYPADPLKYIDPLGLAYFAKRPLDGLPWMGPASNNWLDNYFNTEISHEQLFFEDNLKGLPGNLGYFGDSTVREDAPSLLSKYRKMNQQFDDSLMREAMENVGDMGKYRLFGNNCQVWAEKVLDEYWRLDKVKKNIPGK